MNTETSIRTNLAAAFRLVAYFGYDDLTFTHLSARTPEQNGFYIQPFGFLFEEVTASSLLTVDFDGTILAGKEFQYNKTGYVIHGSVYKHRPDVQAVFHLHTEATLAVSTLPQGLLPLSQWALHFYDRVSYHDYDSLALDNDTHEDTFVRDLGKNNVMFMRNHGVLICGKTIHEAFIYLHHLERACRTQLQAMAAQKELILPNKETCHQAVNDLLGFEPDIGYRDWQALLRLLQRRSENYSQ